VWTKVAPCNNTPRERYSHTATPLPFTPYILFLGGGLQSGDGSSEVFTFNTETMEWKKHVTTGPNVTHVYHTAVVMLDKVWVFGGRSATGSSIFNDIWVLDPETWKWSLVTPTTPKPKNRYYHTACTIDEKMLVFGGRDHDDRFGDLHLFDPKKLEWSQPKMTGTAPGIHSGHSACVIGKKMFLYGGFSGDQMLNQMYILNTDTMEWTQPVLRHGPSGRYLHTMAPMGSRILMFGGCTEGGHVDDFYDIETDNPQSLKTLCLEVICKNLHFYPQGFEYALPLELVEMLQHNMSLAERQPVQENRLSLSP
jgi:N-acetylneuraminic acid mutarotase